MSLLRAKRLSAALLLAGSFEAFAGFSVGFDPGAPFVSGTGDSLSLQGDASASDGILDLGRTGVISLDSFVQPQGAFSVELRVKLDQYGPLSTRYISDFVNTATWSETKPQGFSVRSGGGELYPVLVAEAYSDTSGWRAGSRYFGNTERASISRCLGEFGIGTGTSYWKEVYTDRCLELGKWLHIVVTYDGSEMRYFVDGHDATDGWRVQGADATPLLDSKARLHIGARTLESLDSRHAYASMDFVTVHDSALSPSQIRARYRKSLELAKQDTLIPKCRRTVRMLSPAPGEAVTAKTRLEVEVEASPECGEDTASAWGEQDTLEIQVSPAPDFVSKVEFKSKDSSVSFGEIEGVATGEAYVRCRLKGSESVNGAQAAGRSAAVSEQPWEAARPTVVTGMTAGSGKRVRLLGMSWRAGELRIASAKAPKVLDLAGRRQPWGQRRESGAWLLRPDSGSHGTYLVVTQEVSSPVVLP